MQFLQKKVSVIVVVSLVCIIGCVTINIYFPAEKVESVADQIVNDVRGDETEKPQEQDQSFRPGTILVAFAASPAWAEEKAVSISNPTIRALKADMKKRFQQLKPHYRKGRLQEKDDGYLALTSTKGMGLKDKRDLKNLVEAENRDRKRLYHEVTKAMKLDPSQEDKVAAIFAKKWKQSVP